MPAEFTDFYCRSGGNNLNAGSIDGSTTVPGTSPLVTYTGGDWNSGTDIYTAPVGADLTEAVVGRFASVYHDGDTAPVSTQFLVGRITAVNAGTRQITVSPTARCNLGTEVATGTGNRSMRIGGAWAGPATTDTFPFNSFLSSTITNAASDPVWLNMCSDLATSMEVALSMNGGVRYLGGYTTAPRDGGRWVLAGSTAVSGYTPLSTSVSPSLIQDVEVYNGGNTGTLQLIGVNAATLLRRVVLHDGRGAGVVTSSSIVLDKCELYALNSANSATAAVSGAAAVVLNRCMVHDNTGSNTIGVRITGASHPLVVKDCVIESNGSHGISVTNGNISCLISGNALYANGGDGMSLANGFAAIENNLIFDNGGYGIGGGTAAGHATNNAFGSGTMANASGNIQSTHLIESGTITYAADATPWEDPANGDFRLVSGATTVDDEGDGDFLYTASGYGGSMGSSPPVGPSTRAVAAAASNVFWIEG